MNKKKVGELYGTPIVTGNKNYANGHEYYLTMNEDNTYRKLELRISDDKFRTVLGGGGDYTTPTADDVNKVWQVTPVQKGTKTEETVIVPEQTLINNQELEYNDKFVPGAQCVAVIDGVEYRGEVVDGGSEYVFTAEGFIFVYGTSSETFAFYNKTESLEVTAKLSVIEETPIYDYNWVPGVKIPVPTADDEGKILVVTETEGNTYIVVPEQPAPADNITPLTDVDLTKFVVGNTVKVTVTYEGEQGGEDSGGGKKGKELANSQTFTAIEVIELELDTPLVRFYVEELDNNLIIFKTNNSLYTDATSVFDTDLTIKLEYIEPNYEYQLQENSGGSGSTSNVLWPAMYEYDESEIMATFVPEDVEPNTWCMVCGKIDDDSIDTCLPVLITSYGNYVILNRTDDKVIISTSSVDGGVLLKLVYDNK